MNIDYLVTQDENGVYCAEVPALPGCFSDGRTLTELEDNLREAVQGVLESYAMLPPGASPEDFVGKQNSGTSIRSLSIGFTAPRRHTSRARRHEAAIV